MNNNGNLSFYSTRYQGSKLKILPWIGSHLEKLDFKTCLDAFGGTGCIAYYFKRRNKIVHYNDNLRFNYIIGKAIIENNDTLLEDHDVEEILKRKNGFEYPSFVQTTFKDIFYTDAENRWLDYVISNILSLRDEYKKSIALSALFQSCIIKRPYNLFHRANLYMRTAKVKRTFGNKATWDRPFEYYFRTFTDQINRLVFSNRYDNKSHCKNVFDLAPDYELVYIDTPYINKNKVGVDYLDFYHFLEGIADYEHWEERIAVNYKHKRLIGEKSLWCRPDKIHAAFDSLFDHFKNSIIVVSYRSEGIPAQYELEAILSKYKTVKTYTRNYQYALSPSKGKELLLIGT